MNEANYFWYRSAIVRIFFVEQAFAQLNDANGGKGEDGTKGGVGGGTSGKTINGKNGTSANGHQIGGTTGSGD